MESPPDSQQQSVTALWRAIEELKQRVDALAAQPPRPLPPGAYLADGTRINPRKVLHPFYDQDDAPPDTRPDQTKAAQLPTPQVPGVAK